MPVLQWEKAFRQDIRLPYERKLKSEIMLVLAHFQIFREIVKLVIMSGCIQMSILGSFLW